MAQADVAVSDSVGRMVCVGVRRCVFILSRRRPRFLHAKRFSAFPVKFDMYVFLFPNYSCLSPSPSTLLLLHLVSKSTPPSLPSVPRVVGEHHRVLASRYNPRCRRPTIGSVRCLGGPKFPELSLSPRPVTARRLVTLEPVLMSSGSCPLLTELVEPPVSLLSTPRRSRGKFGPVT